MIEHELRPPVTSEEWHAFHTIRRTVLFENRGKLETYNDNHPDDFKAGHHPLILVHKNVVIGVIRVDVEGTVAWFRRVAIREDVQRSGHGRMLLRLAEAFAKAAGCNEIRSNAAVEAVEFYTRCGYTHHPAAVGPANSVLVSKSLL